MSHRCQKRTSTSEGPWVSQHWRTLHVCSNDERPVVGSSQISDGRIEFKQTEMTDDELLDRSLLGNASDDCRCCVQGNIRTGRDCKMHDQEVRALCEFDEAWIGAVLVGAKHDRHISGLHAIGQGWHISMRDFPCRDCRSLALQNHGWIAFDSVNHSDIKSNATRHNT